MPGATFWRAHSYQPLVCTLHVEGCTVQPRAIHKYATILHYSFCILKNGATSECYTENFLQMATIVFWMAFVTLQTSDSNGKKCVVVVVAVYPCVVSWKVDRKSIEVLLSWPYHEYKLWWWQKIIFIDVCCISFFFGETWIEIQLGPQKLF